MARKLQPGVGLGERLISIRGTLSREDFARRIGSHKSTVANYERGARVPDADFLGKVRDAFKVDLNWLISGGEPPAPGKAVALGGHSFELKDLPGSFVLIPRYNVEASAGPGTFADHERVVDYMAFREDWVRRVLRVDPAKLVLITAVGDSMEPIIRAGDLLLIDTSVDHIIDDFIYVMVKRSELVVKRVQQFFNGGIVVKSDNPAYAEETISEKELRDIHIAGRVRWIGRLY